MTTERVLCMCFGYVPIFIGGGEGLRVEQRGPVRGGKKPSLKVFLRSQKKWKIALSCAGGLVFKCADDVLVDYCRLPPARRCKKSTKINLQ